MLLNSSGSIWLKMYRRICSSVRNKRRENPIFLVTSRVFVITDSSTHFRPSKERGRLTTDIVFVQVRCVCVCER